MKTRWLYIAATFVALIRPTPVIRAQDIQFSSSAEANREGAPNSLEFSPQGSLLFPDQDSDELPLVSLTSVQNSGALPASYSMPRLEVNASLLYLQPGSGSLEYGTLVSPLPAASPHWENQAISPNYSPAFNLGLRYFVPETCNDLRTSWTRLDSTAGASFVGGPGQFAGPPYLIGPGATAYNIGGGSVHFNYNAVNFEAGHLWRSGPAFQVRVFGGVQYASISQNLTGTFLNYADTMSESNTTYSNFSGAGPRFGVNAQFNRRNFQFLGDMAAVAVIGTQHSRMDFVTNSPGYPNNAQSFSSPNGTQIVPGFDSRLGASYSIPFRRGIFKIEGGYQAIVYVNAINSYSLTQVATPPVVGGVGVFFATASHLQNNFTAQGPYLSGSWAF
jgi:hypothetical protein